MYRTTKGKIMAGLIYLGAMLFGLFIMAILTCVFIFVSVITLFNKVVSLYGRNSSVDRLPVSERLSRDS
jgi:uncharacterized membrane protein